MADPTPVLITQRPVRTPNGTEYVPNQRSSEATAQVSTIDAMHDYRWHVEDRAPLPTDNTAAGYGLNHFWKDTSVTPAAVYVKTGESGGAAEWSAMSVSEAGAAVALLETGGPTTLPVGAVPSGTYLRRVGDTIVGESGIGVVVEAVTTDRTLAATDNNKVLLVSGEVTITLPDGLGQGVSVTVVNVGADDVSLAVSGTATLSPESVVLAGGSPSLVQVITLGAEEWWALASGGQQKDVLMLAVGDEATELQALPSRISFRLPYAFRVTEVRANVIQAPEGQSIIFDVNADGNSILTTKLTIDAGETTSLDAASEPVLLDQVLADDTLITVDIDQVGSDYGGRGPKVYLIGYRA